MLVTSYTDNCDKSMPRVSQQADTLINPRKEHGGRQLNYVTCTKNGKKTGTTFGTSDIDFCA
jgi:hypothetical protein